MLLNIITCLYFLICLLALLKTTTCLKLNASIPILTIIIFIGAFTLHSYIIANRSNLLLYPAITNTYEVTVFLSWCIALLALIFSILKHNVAILHLISLVCGVLLLNASLTPFNQEIQPLPAVLQTKFWLILHVVTIIFGYAAITCSMVIAHKYLIKRWSKPAQAELILRLLQIGTVAIGLGTVLGGCWAEVSWGRFWDWDPKESWALITFLSALTILLLYHQSIITKRGLAYGAIISFLFILMTWYGVNFILQSGLHSYGFGSGGGAVVVVYLICELLFLMRLSGFFIKFFK